MRRLGLQRLSNCLLPSFVSCRSCLLNVQLCRGSIFVIKGAEVGGGCFNDRGQGEFLGGFRQKASCDCILHRLDARFGCYECSQVCGSRDVALSCNRFQTGLR